MVRKSDSQYDVFDIPIHEIWVSDDFNCREGISRHSLDSIVNSIEREGLAYPVDVQTAEEVDGIPPAFKFRLVCGFRRVTACKMIGWTSIPARVREGLTDRSAAFMNLAENLERKDLNILEEALAIDRLFEVYRTIRSIAKELNKSESWVSLRKHLLLLPEWVQSKAAAAVFTESHLRAISHSINPEVKAKDILRGLKSPGKYTSDPTKRRPKKKSEVKETIVALLAEGFSPELLRPLGWTIGEVSDEDMEKAVQWLRDRKGWLK